MFKDFPESFESRERSIHATKPEQFRTTGAKARSLLMRLPA
jgi:hypothetical protein